MRQRTPAPRHCPSSILPAGRESAAVRHGGNMIMPTADGKQVTPPANRAPYPSVRIVRTDRSYIHLPGGNGCPVCAQPHRTGVAAGNSHNLPPARDTALSAGILSGGNNATAKLQPDEMRTSGSYRPYVAPVGNSRLHTAVLAHGNHGAVRTQSCDDMPEITTSLQGIPSGKQRTRVRRQPVGIGTAPGCVNAECFPQKQMLPSCATPSVSVSEPRSKRICAQSATRPVSASGAPAYSTRPSVRSPSECVRKACTYTTFSHASVRQSPRYRCRQPARDRSGTAPAHAMCRRTARRYPAMCPAPTVPGNENMPVRRDAGGQRSAGKPPSVPGRLRQSEQVCLSGTLDFCPLCPAVGGKSPQTVEQRCPVEQIAPAGVHPVARSSDRHLRRMRVSGNVTFPWRSSASSPDAPTASETYPAPPGAAPVRFRVRSCPSAVSARIQPFDAATKTDCSISRPIRQGAGETSRPSAVTAYAALPCTSENSPTTVPHVAMCSRSA